MNKKEAIRAMCDGKKVYRETWGRKQFLEMGENGRIFDEDGRKQDINDFEVVNDWEIYEEPKPSATYDEVIKAQKVVIHWPPESLYKQPQDYCRGDGWTEITLIIFHLAEAHHYRMEVIE